MGVAGALSAVIVFACVFAFNLWVLSVVTRMERVGCVCARDWRLQFVHTYTIFALVWSVALVVLGLTGVINHPVVQVANTIASVLSIVNLALALQYISRLRETRCACSESVQRTVWEALLWVRVAAIALLFVVAIAQAIHLMRA